MVVKCADFQPNEFFKNCPLLKNRRGNPAGKKRHYIGITTAFDIETTLIDEIKQSVMYIWQWQFGEDVTVIGRTWEEFSDLLSRVKKSLPADRWLVCYVHNLSYEMEFLKAVYDFKPEEVFAISSRKVLKCDMHDCFEFRCSYKLTNMSLKEFTKKMGVKHQKLDGDEFDYTKKRYPWSELTERELEYCINDVCGLVEAVNALMARDGDTLQTIPLTSTGYVRRDAKKAMRKGVHHNFLFSILPDYETYTALKEAFRGGNTHSNRYYSGDVVKYVHSADRSSSYPAVLCNCEFPMTAFIPIMKKDLNSEYIARCIKIRHKALLLRIGIENLRLRNEYYGCPYLSKDKCRNCHKVIDTFDNGRILKAYYIETTVTDIDLKIITAQYKGKIIFLQGWYASYKKLPQSLIDVIIQYYRDKTELKGVEGKEVYYDKAKALLNALYSHGMMAQDPVKHRCIYQRVGEWKEDDKSDEELLGKSNEKAFLAYQWGCWVTSWARYFLELGIRLAHGEKAHEDKNDTSDNKPDFIYCDTDSVKYTGHIDWSEYNNARIAECMESGAFATDPSGVTHYMGVFENEDDPETGYSYYEFKTLGAKKYAYVKKQGEGVHCTIAGVNKRKGGAELDRHGGLSAFTEGFVFHDAGGTEAIYNDEPEIAVYEIEGHTIKITPNIAIIPSEYTLGITGEYERILKYAKSYLYNPYVI